MTAEMWVLSMKGEVERLRRTLIRTQNTDESTRLRNKISDLLAGICKMTADTKVREVPCEKA